MSDTDGMVRLMEHAAGRLKAEHEALAGAGSAYVEGRRVWVIAAMALAEGVLRMVACSAKAGSHPMADAIEALADYQTWAARNDDASPLSMTDLASVERYLLTAATP